jgi:hypothetical protein
MKKVIAIIGVNPTLKVVLLKTNQHIKMATQGTPTAMT